MRLARFLPVLLALGAVVACSQEITYREGAPVADVQRATDACALMAIRQAPVRNQTTVYPGEYYPPTRSCDANGACVTTPGYYEPPEVVTVDVNKDERTLITRTCLAEKGYSRVRLPLCDASVKAAVSPAVTQRQPKLTPKSCIIPRGAAGYQIVTR